MAQGRPLNKRAMQSESHEVVDVDMSRNFQGDLPAGSTAPVQPQNQEIQEVQSLPEMPSEAQEYNNEVLEQLAPSSEQSSEAVEKEPVSNAQEADHNEKEYNFRAIREEKEKIQRERDELVGYFMQLQKQQAAPTKQEAVPEPDDFGLEEDALLDGRYGKKVHNELKSLRKEINSYKQHTSQQTTEMRIKQEFPDFSQVVSDANIKRLREEQPHLAQTLHDTQDLYTKAASTYAIMKKFGLYQEPAQLLAQKQVTQNINKPRPVNSIAPQQGDSPLHKANLFSQGLTPELKAHLVKEMYECAKNS